MEHTLDTSPPLAGMMSACGDRASLPARTPVRTVIRVAALAGLALAIHSTLAPALEQLSLTMCGHQGDFARLLLVVAGIIYVIAMALPFVPAIEIGLALMLMLGPDAIPIVYAGTQAALLLSFLVGRALPARHLVTISRWLWPGGSTCNPPLPGSLPAVARLPRISRHRHLALAILLNLPGNSVIGGAGGIAMAAGMSRMFRLPAYVLVTALATTPVPVLLWVLGRV